MVSKYLDRSIPRDFCRGRWCPNDGEDSRKIRSVLGTGDKAEALGSTRKKRAGGGGGGGGVKERPAEARCSIAVP